MEKTLTAIEFESMVFVRHLTMTASRQPERDLDRSAYTILTCLDDGRAMSLRELSDTLGLDLSTVSRQTSSMLKSNLIARSPDPDGGMARKFRSTRLGELRLREACEANMRILENVTASWEQPELDAFARLLGRFNRDLEQLQNHPWPRPSFLD